MKKKRKSQFKQRPKCYVQKKTMYKTEKEAGFALRRTWSHDPSVNILDMHTYLCDKCGAWHFGHISYHKAYLEKIQQTSTPA